MNTKALDCVVPKFSRIQQSHQAVIRTNADVVAVCVCGYLRIPEHFNRQCIDTPVFFHFGDAVSISSQISADTGNHVLCCGFCVVAVCFRSEEYSIRYSFFGICQFFNSLTPISFAHTRASFPLRRPFRVYTTFGV